MRTEEEILERVRRLFALAKSSNEHESAAAAAKAQELLHKYSFRMGIITALKARLDKQQVVQRAESALSTALVVQSKAELDAAVAMRYPRLSYTRAQMVGSLDGYGAGSKAGSHLSVNAGLYQGVGQRRIG